MSYLLLGVNIDHIATLRNVRGTQYPNPMNAVFIAEQSGADSITVHLREDRRHITDQDVFYIQKIIHTTMNLEIAATDNMVNFACQLKPHSCCLVPERRQELTTEKGLDVINQLNKLKGMVCKLINCGIQTSLFIEPDEQQIAAAYHTGTSCIELHTGMYADAMTELDRIKEYQRLKNSVQYAVNYGLKVNAGHGLNYHNVRCIAMLSQIQELNIGHSIISRALFCGLSKAIYDMKALLIESRRGL